MFYEFVKGLKCTKKRKKIEQPIKPYLDASVAITIQDYLPFNTCLTL